MPLPRRGALAGDQGELLRIGSNLEITTKEQYRSPMTEENWTKFLGDLTNRYPLKCREGVDEAQLESAENAVGTLPEDLRCFYKVANGLRYEWFNILAIEEHKSIMETWDGLRRANNLQTTRFLGRRPELLERFLVFAEIGGGHCACIRRQDGSVWFEDSEGLHETDMTLFDFLEASLREVNEI